MIAAAAGLIAIGPAGVAHADLCRNGYNPSIHFGPNGCINPLWRPSFGGGGSAPAPPPVGQSSWPPAGGSTWPPS